MGEEFPTTVLQLDMFQETKLDCSEVGKSLLQLPSHLRALAIVYVTEGPWEDWLGASFVKPTVYIVIGLFLSGI